MLGRVREALSPARLADIWSGFVDSFLRGNKVLPPVLALLALLIFAWIVTGFFMEPPADRVSQQSMVAQSPAENPSPDDRSGTPAPEVENRNVDSYAEYGPPKDPFRQLLEPATETTNGGATTPAAPGGTTGNNGGSGAGGTNGGGNSGGAGGGNSGGAGGGNNGGGAGRNQDGGRPGDRTNGGGGGSGLFDSGGNLP